MRFTRLPDWLSWQETLHPRAIDLGLDRVRRVADALGLGTAACPVITIGGTNGKGSCASYLEAMYSAAGFRTGIYTSPHIRRYNERVRFCGREATDTELCDAFAAVDQARGDISLTYFEFGTLAALHIFSRQNPDLLVLEVGLGGRLDAVNIVDADVALVVSIGIDHTDWLGMDRGGNGREKAGIFRSGRPAVCGDRAPPASLPEVAQRLDATLFRIGVDFEVERTSPELWAWNGWTHRLSNLPTPALFGLVQFDNAASSIACVELLQEKLPVSADSIRLGMRQARLPGRFEILAGDVLIILDVAHNAEACAVLAENLRQHPVTGKTLAVIGMLGDKPVEEVGNVMVGAVDSWYIGGLQHLSRGLDAGSLATRLGQHCAPKYLFQDVLSACKAARQQAQAGDRLVIFGSFHALEAVWEWVHG
jgi:dihydrofolate synthase/folylpolyglutamate synthase